MKINPLTAIDFYKADHRRQYPEGTTEVYANFTPRSSHLAQILPEFFDQKIIFFGLQYFIKYFLMEIWGEHFFNREKSVVISKYKQRMDHALGIDTINMEHISALHDLGYLPLKIKALPEGSSVPIGVPVLTIVNTHPDFFWLPNYIESVLSCYLWKPITTATIASHFKKQMIHYAIKTGTDLETIKYQVHDFSFRGMSGISDAALSGAAHLTSFMGTDCVAAIDLLEDYYGASPSEEMVGCSIPATEHSVMCMHSKEKELETFTHLITECYPSGPVSIVSDTWDFWKVITSYALQLKDTILTRNGKVVFRPDSGDPVKIVAGDPDAVPNTPEYKGAIECLWEIFGGTITDKGYKLLNPKVGLIYGDSITIKRAQQILEGLENKKFSSGNVIFGVGSYTYQYTTRDTFGFAMKSTSGVVNGERREIFKDPKTDSGVKRSAKGLLRVEEDGKKYTLSDQQTKEQEDQGVLEIVYEDGILKKSVTLSQIRNRARVYID